MASPATLVAGGVTPNGIGGVYAVGADWASPVTLVARDVSYGCERWTVRTAAGRTLRATATGRGL